MSSFGNLTGRNATPGARHRSIERRGAQLDDAHVGHIRFGRFWGALVHIVELAAGAA